MVGVAVRWRAYRFNACKHRVNRLVHPPFSPKCNRLQSFEIRGSSGLVGRQGTV